MPHEDLIISNSCQITNHIDESTSQKLLFQSNFSFPRTSIVPQHQWTTHNGGGAERESGPSEQYQRPLVEHAEYEPAIIRQSPIILREELIFLPRALLLIPFYGGMKHFGTQSLLRYGLLFYDNDDQLLLMKEWIIMIPGDFTSVRQATMRK